MPELTERELLVLTRYRMHPWVGIFWMVLAAVLSQVSRPMAGQRWVVAIAYWAALFVALRAADSVVSAGLVWFIVAHRREAERVKVLRSLSSSGGISIGVSAAVPKRPLLLRAADSVVSAVKKVAKSGPSQ